MFNPGPSDKDSILEAMRMGVDYRFKLTLRAFSMIVRPLTIIEEQNIVANVTDYIAGLPQQARNSLTENVALAKEYIKEASTTDVGSKDYKIHDYQLDRMTPEEIQFLYRQYLDAKEQVNPSIEKMDPEQLQSLLARLKKSLLPADWASQTIELSRSQLVRVCRSLLHDD
jgi:hypothetical protein